jgi:hypothetical protein
MSVFQCSHCGCLENTALSGGYLLANLLERDHPAYASYLEVLGLSPTAELGQYCSACNPAWYNPCTCGTAPHKAGYPCGDYGIGKNPHPSERKGIWHGRFDRVFYPHGQVYTDGQGNPAGAGLAHPSETEHLRSV